MKLERRGSFGWPATEADPAPCRNGLVAHYDGSDQGLADKPHSACRTYWKDTREFHMRAKSRGGRGWADIGYSFGVCPHGYVLEGRGWQRQQAAQPGGNTTWTSCTFMSGEHEKPTTAQVNAFRELRAWLRGKDLAAAISYHGRFISTTCPGGILRQMVTSGALAGTPSKEASMALTDADAQKVARAMLDIEYNLSHDQTKDALQTAKNGMEDIRPRIQQLDEAFVPEVLGWLTNIANAVGATNPNDPQ